MHDYSRSEAPLGAAESLRRDILTQRTKNPQAYALGILPIMSGQDHSILCLSHLFKHHNFPVSNVMNNKLFDISFNGQPIDGFSVESVKSNIQTLFGMDENSVEQMFSGGNVILKSGLDRASAAKYQAALLKAGAKIQITVSNSDALSSQPAGQTNHLVETSGENENHQKKTQSTTSGASLGQFTLAPIERDNADNIFLKSDNNALSEQTQPTYPASLAEHVDSPFTLAERGVDLLRDDEKPAVTPKQVDISHLQLAD